MCLPFSAINKCYNPIVAFSSRKGECIESEYIWFQPLAWWQSTTSLVIICIWDYEYMLRNSVAVHAISTQSTFTNTGSSNLQYWSSNQDGVISIWIVVLFYVPQFILLQGEIPTCQLVFLPGGGWYTLVIMTSEKRETVTRKIGSVHGRMHGELKLFVCEKGNVCVCVCVCGGGGR